MLHVVYVRLRDCEAIHGKEFESSTSERDARRHATNAYANGAVHVSIDRYVRPGEYLTIFEHGEPLALTA